MPNLTSVEKEFSNLTKKRGFLSSSIDKDIADSWKRCISTGLDPLKKPKRMILSSKELDELKEKNEYIRRLVNPELELLYSQIAGTNFMVAYSDSIGSVMDTIYDKTCLKTDVGKIVIPGSIWREEIGGTNGLLYTNTGTIGNRAPQSAQTSENKPKECCCSSWIAAENDIKFRK